MKRSTTSFLILLAVLATAAQAVTIETVPVGNLGNTDDTHGDGYGGVDYAYNIGKYEVTAGQYTEFLNAVAGVDTYGLYNSNMWLSDYGCKIERYAGNGTAGDPYQYRVPDANRANRPVNYVSWGDAARFSNWLHNGQPSGSQDDSTTEDGAYYLDGADLNDGLMTVNRESDAIWVLPDEDEWYKAAYYNGGASVYYDYPTSSDIAPINTVETTDPGNHANFYDMFSTGSGGYTVGSPYYTTVVGEFENSESPYGTFDQGGNLFEWNETEILTGSTRGLRGGDSFRHFGRLAASYRYIDGSPASEDENVGFRVAQVPEPGTCTLLAILGLALAFFRCRKKLELTGVLCVNSDLR